MPNDLSSLPLTRGGSRSLMSAINALSKGTFGLQTLTDAATVAYDCALGVNGRVTLAGNRTFAAPTNAQAGTSGYLEITQGGGGSNTGTWNAAWRFPGGTDITLSTAAGAVDVIQWWTPDGAVFHVVGQYKALA